jgi:hypothetical protein
MSAKTIVTVLLLAFVALSVGYLVVSESSTKPTPKPTATPQSAPTATPAGAKPPTDATAASVPANRVIAYYFHNTRRCVTCLKIERLAEEALRERFASAFKDGTLTWMTINMEEPANKHFVEDYGLVTSSVVLVDIEDGKTREWITMGDVWQLVHDDENTFKTYIVTQARDYLRS